MAQIRIKTELDGSVKVEYSGSGPAVLGLLKIATTYIEKEIFSTVTIKEEEREL